MKRAALPLVLILALGLRVIYLNDLGFNSDEAVYSGQAAAIAEDESLSQFFPIFRSHPLLVQFILSLVFRITVSDLAGRILAALIGVATVACTYALGRHLFGSRAGILSAMLLAIMPYHVIVSRQVLLDGALTLFSTLTLYFMSRYAEGKDPKWLYAAGAGMGLTFLSKEAGIILLVSIYAFLALSPSIRVQISDLAKSMGLMVLIILPFPITLMLAGGGGVQTTQQYLVWQLFRRPNHDWAFYPTAVGSAMGPLVILAALLGLWGLRKRRSWREVLLLTWVVIPIIFFQAWPVKGFQYLLLIAPPIAVLAARALAAWSSSDRDARGVEKAKAWIRTFAVAGIALSLLIPAIGRIRPAKSATFLAGSGGVPGGREAGLWLLDNSPQGSTLMTIGPSMANILQFYGHRKAFGLSVSPNPLHRNPSYQSIRNPDFEIRTGEFQYLVWDAYSAARSSFFSEKLLKYVERYNGRVVHTESIDLPSSSGTTIAKPVIIIYEVRP